jgi:hypothetical protein
MFVYKHTPGSHQHMRGSSLQILLLLPRLQVLQGGVLRVVIGADAPIASSCSQEEKKSVADTRQKLAKTLKTESFFILNNSFF